MDLVVVKSPGFREQKTEQDSAIPIEMRPKHSSLAQATDAKTSPTKHAPSIDQEEVQGVYIISVAARMLEMHPQTLRKYERLGLVSPSRIIGTWRLYSQEDIEKLRLIKHLAENVGLNLAGVEFILNLLEHLTNIRRRLAASQQAERLQHQIERELERLFRELNLPLEG